MKAGLRFAITFLYFDTLNFPRSFPAPLKLKTLGEAS